MKLANLLSEQRIFLNLQAKTCGEVMAELVGHLGDQGVLTGHMQEDALDALQCREQEISTGVGCGVGLPHAYLNDLSEAVAVFGRSDEGIEFHACDHAPVHFVVLLLIPENKKGQHLLTLADIGRRFLSCEVRKSLASAGTCAEILEILS